MLKRGTVHVKMAVLVATRDKRKQAKRGFHRYPFIFGPIPLKHVHARLAGNSLIAVLGLCNQNDDHDQDGDTEEQNAELAAVRLVRLVRILELPACKKGGGGEVWCGERGGGWVLGKGKRHSRNVIALRQAKKQGIQQWRAVETPTRP